MSSHGLLDLSAEEAMMNLSRAAQNPYLRCPMVAQPSFAQSQEVLGSLGTTLLAVGGVVVAFIFVVYLDIVRHLVTRTPARFRANSIMAVTIYPVMSLVTYLAIVVPRFQLLCEAFVMFAWMVALYHVFSLFVAYSGGETELTRRVESAEIDIQIAPCCCWPCCCFPKLPLDKNHLRIPRLLVLQLSVVQFIVYLCLLVMWSEEELMYQEYFLYFQIVAIPSIFVSIWGITMMLRMLAPTLAPYHMYGKYIALQMALLCTKCQGTAARVIVMILQEPCTTDLSPSVLSYLICNGIFLLELIVLVLVARMFYRRPLPDEDDAASTPGHHFNNNNAFHLQGDLYIKKKEGIDNIVFTSSS